MENWEKAKGTGQQENNPQEGKQIFRAASRRGPKTKEKASPVLTVQMALCGFLLVLVLAVRSFSPELFAALGSAYGRALTDGAALTGSGELFRFAEKNLQSLQEKLRRAIAQLDGGAATNAGSAPAVGVAAAGGDGAKGGEYAVTHAGYLATVTLAPYILSDRPQLPVRGTMTSPFGYRTHPITGKLDFHTGIDLATPEETPVAAAWSGVVAETGCDRVNGRYVKLLHSGTVCTSYNHLSRIDVTVGSRVRRGETVGLVGSTGVSTGPHLHFELLIDGVRVDPAAALKL